LVAGQFASFFFTLVIGVILGVIIDAYRSFHRLVRLSPFIIAAGDFLLWLFLALLVFFLLLFNNWGEIRAYVFIGIGVGLIIYHYWFSKSMLYFWYKLFFLIGKIFKLFFAVILFPFRLFKSLLIVLVGAVSYCLNPFQRLVFGSIHKMGHGWRRKLVKLKSWVFYKIKKNR